MNWKWFNPHASQEENRRRWKKLSVEHHPDKHGGTAGATAMFQDISSEYDRLNAFYDAGGDRNGSPGASAPTIRSVEIRNDGVYVQYEGKEGWYKNAELSGLLPNDIGKRIVVKALFNLVKYIIK